MTEPARTPHPSDPAEGAEEPGTDDGGQTPHSEDPAEGADVAEDSAGG